MIRIEHLSKTFNMGKKAASVLAVDDLSLEIARGEAFGFLGPNGAGKTTTVRMLACLIAPSSGRAWVNERVVGRDDQQIRQSVGILTESPGMYDRLSAERNLSIFARLYRVADVQGQVSKYLKMLGLYDRRHDEVGSFSKGMRQKLAIARALLHEPEVLFLDEPTSGLDPEAARLVRDFIEDLKIEGRTIFICTHNLDEADRLCQRIAIFRTRLVTVDTPLNLRKQLYGRKVVFHLRELRPEWKDLLGRISGIKEVSIDGQRFVVGLDDPEGQNPRIIKTLVEAGAEIQFVGEVRHSLEDVYLKLIRDGQEGTGA